MEPQFGTHHDDPRSANEEVARLRLTLRNTHLSTLVERGFLTYDRDENLVRKGPRFETLQSLLNSSDNPDGELPEEYL